MQVLEVAGVSLGVQSETPLIGPLSAKHALFTREATAATITLTLERGPLGSGGTLAFDSQSVWRVYRDGTGVRYDLTSPAFTPALYKQVALDANYERGRLATPGVTTDPSRSRPHPLDAPLDQLLISHHCALRGHVELHCCALVIRGRAVVLTGFSGAGKTTSARLWATHRPGTPILSDDRVIIRREGQALQVHGTPWCGEGQFALNTSAPLGAVVLLQHGADNAVSPVAPALGARELYRRTFPPVWHGEAVAATLETLGVIAAQVPILRFTSRPDASAVDALAQALTQWVP